MAASARRHMPLLLSIIVVVCMSGKMGHGLEASSGRSATCGGYTYMLPEGFMDTNLHMKFKEYLHIDTLFSAPIGPGDSFVGCITVDRTNEDGFIAGRITAFMRGEGSLKNPIRDSPVQYPIELSDFIRLYYFTKLYYVKAEMDFTYYLIELKAEADEDHALLYVRDLTYPEIPDGDSRTCGQRESAENSPKKERAMRLIDSVRRVYE